MTTSIRIPQLSGVTVFIDDVRECVTVTVPAEINGLPRSFVRECHDLAGDLGYGIEFIEPNPLSDIRKSMTAALTRRDMAEFSRLGAEHRRILHAARPDIKVQWERCRTDA